MTIDLTDNAPRISYTVNQGVTQTSFTVPFEFFDTTDLKVVVDGTTKTITSHYTVSGGDGSTGTVTMSVTGASGGSTVIIYREIPLSRSTDFPTSGAFPIATLNTELDRTVALFDDRKDRIDRSIRLLDTDDAATMTLPTKDNRKGTVLGFNATTGAVEAGPTIANVSSLSSITSNINTLGAIASNVTTVAGISSDVTTVANISSNVTTVAGISSNVTTVAGKASLITSQFASDMSLVTSDFVTDMNLVTSDFVADMALVTSDFVSDMALVTADFVSDLNLITSDVITDMNLLATSANVTAMANLGTSTNVTNMANLNASGVISNIGTVVTNLSDITNLANTLAGVDTFTVTVVSSGGNKFALNGATNPTITLRRGITYTFDQSDSSNAGHPIAFKDSSDNAYTTGVTSTGTPGSSGAKTTFEVASDAPSSLKYYCTVHGNAMGNTISVVDDNIGIVAGSITNINTVAAANSNISALNASGVITNIGTVATNVADVNSFANRYRIASSAPTSSLDAGDLYFDTSTNKLNVYSGSNWQSTAEAAQRTVTTHNVTSAGTQTISVSYTVGLVDVYLNGLKLNIAEGDATASNGSSVVVTSASIGDIIEVVALSAFNAANYGTAASKNVGIGNDNVPVFTSGAADNDFLRIDGTSIEGRSASEVLSDIGGQASLTFGIANTNAVKIDHASVASTDYAKFTSNGLEGKSFAEVRSDLNVADGANAYVHPNHSGEVTSTADGATEIADNVVDEANLKVSNTPTNGYFLSAQSGNTGGLTWAAVASGGAWEEVAGGDFSGVTSITQSFSQDYIYRVLLFNLQLDPGSGNSNINYARFPAIQLNYGAGAGTAVTIRHSRISLAPNSTTWSNNSYNTLTRAAISNSNPIRANGNNSNQTSATYDLYITQPSASGTYANHAWTACRWWCTSWGYYDSQTGYSKYSFAEGAETSNTGSFNLITSFKIIDNALTSDTFSGTYRVLRIGAS